MLLKEGNNSKQRACNKNGSHQQLSGAFRIPWEKKICLRIGDLMSEIQILALKPRKKEVCPITWNIFVAVVSNAQLHKPQQHFHSVILFPLPRQGKEQRLMMVKQALSCFSSAWSKISYQKERALSYTSVAMVTFLWDLILLTSLTKTSFYYC